MNSASTLSSIAPSILHQLDVPVAYFDDQLVCHYCNVAYVKYWKCASDKLIQQPLYLTWKAHLALLTPYLEDVLRGTDGRVALAAESASSPSTILQLIAHRHDQSVQGFYLVVHPQAETSPQVQLLQRELEALAYSISHDFRAPLRHIEGFSRLLQARVQTEDADTLKYLNYIRQGATELSTMIDALLAYSRLGRRTLEHNTLNMSEIVQRVITDTQALHRQRNITWQLETLPNAYGDEEMIEHLWELLIDNAVKFTQHTEGARITIGAIASPGAPAVYYVRDNGIGFDPSFQDNLFGVFQRLHRHDEYPGLGIGLAHASRILHRHQGRIWAEATIDQGATFYFELP